MGVSGPTAAGNDSKEYLSGITSQGARVPGWTSLCFICYRFAVCVYGYIHAIACVWRSEDNSRDSLLTFHYTGSWGLNSGHQAWRQVPLIVKPSRVPWWTSLPLTNVSKCGIATWPSMKLTLVNCTIKFLKNGKSLALPNVLSNANGLLS